MSKTIAKNIQAFTEEARKVVEDLATEEAKELYQNSDYIFVDVREASERDEHGLIPGAFTCPRGMLEFLIDPEFPAHNTVFAHNKTYVFYCSHGLRSLYAAKLALDMGLEAVKNLSGGFTEWTEKGGTIENQYSL